MNSIGMPDCAFGHVKAPKYSPNACGVVETFDHKIAASEQPTHEQATEQIFFRDVAMSSPYTFASDFIL